SLFFAKVLDTFEEIDDSSSLETKPADRVAWQAKAPWTLETADGFLAAVQDLFAEPKLNYTQGYIAINVSGNNYFWLEKRSDPKSMLWFRMTELLQETTGALLDANSISYVRRPQHFRIPVDKGMVEKNRD